MKKYIRFLIGFLIFPILISIVLGLMYVTKKYDLELLLAVITILGCSTLMGLAVSND